MRIFIGFMAWTVLIFCLGQSSSRWSQEQYIDTNRAEKGVLSAFNNLPYPIYYLFSYKPLNGQPVPCAGIYDGAAYTYTGSGCLSPGASISVGTLNQDHM